MFTISIQIVNESHYIGQSGLCVGEEFLSTVQLDINIQYINDTISVTSNRQRGDSVVKVRLPT